MYQRLQQNLKEIQMLVQMELEKSAIDQSMRSVSAADRKHPVVPSTSGNLSTQLVQGLGEVKQMWAELETQALTHSQWQALATEFHKQLRLAEIDIRFWAAARQSKTAKQRGQQLCDRLSTLIDYCTVGIKLSQQNSDETDADVLP